MRLLSEFINDFKYVFENVISVSVWSILISVKELGLHGWKRLPRGIANMTEEQTDFPIRTLIETLCY